MARIRKKISNVKHLSEDDTVIFFGRFNMLKDKGLKNDKQIITTFYEDYGYIPIGVHIKEKDKFYYMPKNPDEFFIGNGKELYTGCIDFTFTEYSSAINNTKIQEYVTAIKTLREYIMGLPFDMRYFNSNETKTDKLKAYSKK